MTGFSTSTELEVEVDERSLRDARSTIEGRVGSVTVSPQQTRADGGRSRGVERRSRENAMTRQLLEQQIELLDDMQDDVEQIAQSGGGGGGGGGGLLGEGGSLAGGAGAGALGSRLAGGLGTLGGAAAGGAGLAAGGGLGILLGSWWLAQNTEGDQRDPREVGSNPREPGSDGPNVMATQGTANRGVDESGGTSLEEPSGPGVREDPTNEVENLNAQDGVLMANRGNGEDLAQQDGVLAQRENQQQMNRPPARTSEAALREKLNRTGGGEAAPESSPNVDVQVDASVDSPNLDRIIEDVQRRVQETMQPEIDDLKQQLDGGGHGMGRGPL